MSGTLNPRYKDGGSLKIYSCLDCGKEITYQSALYGSHKCASCCQKGKTHMEYSSYKDGRTKKLYFCKQCNAKIGINSGVYGTGLCVICSGKLRSHRMSMGNNPSWKGGKSFEEYGAEFDNELKEQIRLRDNYKCQTCGCTQLENGRQLDVHHIDYDKHNCNCNNLVALCMSCHSKTNYNRGKWIKRFQKK